MQANLEQSDWRMILHSILTGAAIESIEARYGSVITYIDSLISQQRYELNARGIFMSALSKAFLEWDPLEGLSKKGDRSLRVGCELLMEYRPTTGWSKVMIILESAKLLHIYGRHLELRAAMALVPRFFGHFSFDADEKACFVAGAEVLYEIGARKNYRELDTDSCCWAVACLVCMGTLTPSGDFKAGELILGNLESVTYIRDTVIRDLRSLLSGYLLDKQSERLKMTFKTLDILNEESDVNSEDVQRVIIEKLTYYLDQWPGLEDN